MRGQPLGFNGIFNQIAVLDLGEDRLQRPAKPVQHADRILERRDSRPADGERVFLEERALLRRMNEKRGPAIDSRLQQPHAFFSGHPALYHHVIQLFAQELVDHRFMLAAHFEEIRKRSHWRHAVAQRAGLQETANCVCGVAVIANQRLQRVAAAGNRGLLAAQLVGARPLRVLFCTLGLQSRTQSGNLALQALKRVGCRFKAQLGLATLDAQVFLLVPRLAHLRMQPLRLAFKGGKAFLSLCRVVAGVAGQCQQMHGVTAGGFQLPLGGKNFFGSRAGFLLAGLNLLPEGTRFACRSLQEGVLLRALLGDTAQLTARNLKLRRCGGDSRFQLAHALGVGALPRRGAFQFDRRSICLVLSLLHLAVQLVAALGEGVLVGFQLAYFRSRAVDALGQRSDLPFQSRLLGVHLRHAA